MSVRLWPKGVTRNMRTLTIRASAFGESGHSDQGFEKIPRRVTAIRSRPAAHLELYSATGNDPKQPFANLQERERRRRTLRRHGMGDTLHSEANER